jgi:hypothetical protein
MCAPRTVCFGVLLMLGACTSRVGSGAEQAGETTMSSGSETADTEESEEGGETQTPTPDLPPADPCMCEDGAICVADCLWSADYSDYVDNFRCVDDPACLVDPQDPQCGIASCGYSAAVTSNCDTNSEGVDLICFGDFELEICDELLKDYGQDCPEGDKCVFEVLGWEQAHGTRCVEVTGTAAPGESCTSEGATIGTDDCDAQGMCWNGAISTEPFVGTCHAYCADVDGQLTCPESSSCQVFGDNEFHLCIPDP